MPFSKFVESDYAARCCGQTPKTKRTKGENGTKVGVENGTKVGVENGTKVGVENGTKVGVDWLAVVQ
eukprot:2227305-Rhodomonas_salina.1